MCLAQHFLEELFLRRYTQLVRQLIVLCRWKPEKHSVKQSRAVAAAAGLLRAFSRRMSSGVFGRGDRVSATSRNYLGTELYFQADLTELMSLENISLGNTSFRNLNKIKDVSKIQSVPSF